MRAFAFVLYVAFSTTTLAIFRGDLATEDQLASAVQIWSMTGNTLVFRCSGTLIAPDVVLTEASCIYLNALEKYGDTFLISRSSKTDFSKPLADILQRILAVVRSDIKHPTEDLALLFLSQAVPVRPAILMQQSEVDQIIRADTVYLAGWGYTELPPEKPFFSWNYEDTRKPGTKHTGKSLLSAVRDQELSFGDGAQNAVACSGDQGGPIMIHIETRYKNQERLIGMIRSSPNLHVCASPSIGLRIDAFQPFIKEQLELGCQKGDRAWCEIKGLIPPDTETAKVIEIPSHTPTSNPAPERSQVPPPIPATTHTLKVRMESMGCHCGRSFRK